MGDRKMARGKGLEARNTNSRSIAFYGDSLTNGRTGVLFYPILKSRLTDSTLLNFGKSGDTVISLLRRIQKGDLPSKKVDAIVLWIGVNDVLVRVSASFPIIKLMHGQTWSRNLEHFTDCYQKILSQVRPITQKIYCVSPICIGEDFDNRWNRLLKERSDAIRSLCQDDLVITFVDLQKAFIDKFGEGNSTSYIPNSAIRIVWDGFTKKSISAINGTSSERVLQFTVDGVHMNSRGAEMVADVFEEMLSE